MSLIGSNRHHHIWIRPSQRLLPNAGPFADRDPINTYFLNDDNFLSRGSFQKAIPNTTQASPLIRRRLIVTNNSTGPQFPVFFGWGDILEMRSGSLITSGSSSIIGFKSPTPGASGIMGGGGGGGWVDGTTGSNGGNAGNPGEANGGPGSGTSGAVGGTGSESWKTAWTEANLSDGQPGGNGADSATASGGLGGAGGKGHGGAGGGAGGNPQGSADPAPGGSTPGGPQILFYNELIYHAGVIGADGAFGTTSFDGNNGGPSGPGEIYFAFRKYGGELTVGVNVFVTGPGSIADGVARIFRINSDMSMDEEDFSNSWNTLAA